MTHQRLLISGAIMAFIIIAGFVLSVPHTRDLPLPAAVQTEESRVPEVALRDTYRKGVHTITGSLDVPDACTSVSAEATLAEDGSHMAVAVLTVEDSGVCLERKSTIHFSTTLTAPARLPIIVTVDGVLATTTDL